MGLVGAPVNHCSTENALSQVRRKHLMTERMDSSVRTALVGFPPTTVTINFLVKCYGIPISYLSWKLSSMTSCIKPVKGTLELMLCTREGVGRLWDWVTLHCSLTYCCQNSGCPKDKGLPKSTSGIICHPRNCLPFQRNRQVCVHQRKREEKKEKEERCLTKEILKVLQCRRSKLQSSCCPHACESCREFGQGKIVRLSPALSQRRHSALACVCVGICISMCVCLSVCLQYQNKLCKMCICTAKCKEVSNTA